MIQDTATPATNTDITDRERSHKIQSLREMINSAESTIQSAKSMLLQLEGKKKVGRKRKVEEIENGSVIEGAFDGQIMIGNDGKHYPVPANYASKSKLIQGDILKLTITPDGSFIYKQIGPANRRNAIGVISQDENGHYFIVADGRAYHVLLASITYFKAEPGDEVAIVIPRDIEPSWCAIENILQKGALIGSQAIHTPAKSKAPATDMEHWKSDVIDTPEPIQQTAASVESSVSEPTPEPESMPIAPAEAPIDEPVPAEPIPATTADSVIATPTEAVPATPSDDEAERLRQEIIDEWLKDTEAPSTPSAVTTEKA